MKKICLIGPVDKRAITYPLIKLLDLTGKTLIVSDDGNFRKFDDEFEPLFTKGRVDFRIIPVLDDEGVESINTTGYDYVIYVVANLLVKDCDKYVYCHSLNKGVCTKDVIDTLEDKVEDYKDVVITPSVVKDRSILKVPMDKDTIGYIWGCEEANQFIPCKNAKITKLIAYLFSDVLDIPQDTIVKALGRGDE